MSKALGRMAQAGLVTRAKYPQDRRLVRVFLTDEGRAMRGDIERMWRTLEETAAGALDAEQVEAFVASARAVQRAIEDR